MARVLLIILLLLTSRSSLAIMCKKPNGTIVVSEHSEDCGPRDECRDKNRQWSMEACKEIAAVAEQRTRNAEETAATKKLKEEQDRKDQLERDVYEKAHALEPYVGMSIVDAARTKYYWGEPVNKNITTTATGRHEQWVYTSNRYLYFDNGVLTSIQE